MKTQEIILRCKLGFDTTAKQAETAKQALTEIPTNAGWRKPFEIEIVEQ